MSVFHLNTISQGHEKLMWQLGKLIHGQLLIGGTALALQIGHRQSEDLDFVIPNPVPENIVELIKASSPENELEHLIRNKQQYTGYCGQIKITYFHDPVKFLHPLKDTFNTQIADVKDIFSSKLYVLSRRATWRDYVDIAIMLDRGIASLEEGIKDAFERHQINEKWILEPLTYFDDIAYQPIKFIGKQYTNDEIQSIIKKHAHDYIKKKLTK